MQVRLTQADHHLLPRTVLLTAVEVAVQVQSVPERSPDQPEAVRLQVADIAEEVQVLTLHLLPEDTLLQEVQDTADRAHQVQVAPTQEVAVAVEVIPEEAQVVAVVVALPEVRDK